MDRIQIRAGSLEQFPSLFRRLSRIFSHAYYHHRETFHLAEAETSLYARFVALCEKYDLVGSNLLVIPRHVIADILDGKSAEPEIEVEEEEDDDDEEDEDEDEGDEERDSRSRDKGESGRRPHSLDRHARPHELGGWRQKGPAAAEGTVRGWPQVQPDQPAKAEEASEPPVSQASQDQDLSIASSSSASVSTATPASTSMPSSSTGTTTNPDPVSSNTSQTYSLKPRPPKDGGKPKQHLDINKKEIGTLGRSTLGKKSRGTMLWTSEPAVPPTQDVPSVSTPTAETVGAPLERTGSVETAILAPEDLEGDGPMPAVKEGGGMPTGVEEAGEEEMPVPKDEIELLEEEGKLDIKAAVSPLPPTTPSPDTKAEISSLPPTTLATDTEAPGSSLPLTTATATTTKDTKADDVTTTSKDTTKEADTSDTKPATPPLPSNTATQSASTSKSTPTKSAKSSKPTIKAPSSILGTGIGSFVPPEVEKPKSSNSASSKGKSKSETSPKEKSDATLPTSKESAVEESEAESDQTDTVEKGV